MQENLTNELQPNKDINRLIKTMKKKTKKRKKMQTGGVIDPFSDANFSPRPMPPMPIGKPPPTLPPNPRARMREGGVAKPFDHYKASGCGR